MFKKLSFLLIIFLLVLMACSSVKILRQTENDAIIEAEADTKAQALLKAEDKARELFGDFTETKEPICSQKITQDYTASAGSKSTSAGISSTWVCAIYVQRK